jgi:hypothetical protein
MHLSTYLRVNRCIYEAPRDPLLSILDATSNHGISKIQYWGGIIPYTHPLSGLMPQQGPPVDTV